MNPHKENLLINTISDCILINHLGVGMDKSLFTSFENMCYLLGIDYYEIDPILFKQLEGVIKTVRLEEKENNTEIVNDLMQHATLLLPQIRQIVKSYE